MRLGAIAALLPAVATCGPGERPAIASNGSGPYRTAWLGSAEGWGLLGLPERGGVLAYRSARNLGSPTWAPPELDAVRAAQPALGNIWVQFRDGRLGSYDYSTGHLRTYGELAEGTRLGLPHSARSAILIEPDSMGLSLVGEGAPWRFNLGGRLTALVAVGEERVISLARADSGVEIAVLRPPEKEALGRTVVPGVGEFVVTAWGRRLYYLTGLPGDATVYGLSIPELRPIGELELSGTPSALAATPSGHRLYVAVGDSLEVFDRLAGRRLRSIELPGPVSSLRFGVNGAALLGRVEGADRAVVLQVGIDSILGVVVTRWAERLPVALPGGRLVAWPDSELVLYTLPELAQIARVPDGPGTRLWLPVEWHPPRPRPELVRRLPSAGRDADGATDTAVARIPAGTAPLEPGRAPPGYYAVVLAARARPGVDSLVRWLQSVGYTATLERHRDNMGVVWYRAMVGPYSGRIKAESAARSLSARYGRFKPWILSVTEAETPPAEPSDSVGDPAGGEEPGEEDSSQLPTGPDADESERR